MKNAIYGQSGGPTSVINSSAYGVITQLRKYTKGIDKVFCMHYGIEGFLNENIIDTSIFSDKDLKKLLSTPGAAFGSNRFKLKNFEDDEETYKNIFNLFRKYEITYFFYNGGNDSMDTIAKISAYAKKINYELYAIGVPKTIDNDLVYFDHTPGYGSAIKFIANAVSQVYFDDHSYQNGRVNIVEIMGRNAGFLTAGSKLAELNGAEVDLIYVPERNFNIDEFLAKVYDIYKVKNRCLVCVSEGIHDENNKLISTAKSEFDSFGHSQLGGVGAFLSDLVTQKLGIKSRYIELSLLQRADTNIVSSVDQKEAIQCGRKAVDAAIKHNTGKIITIIRTSNNPYKVKYEYTDIAKVALQEKVLPDNFINETNDNITDDFIEYAKPLIGRENEKLVFPALKINN